MRYRRIPNTIHLGLACNMMHSPSPTLWGRANKNKIRNPGPILIRSQVFEQFYLLSAKEHLVDLKYCVGLRRQKGCQTRCIVVSFHSCRKHLTFNFVPVHYQRPCVSLGGLRLVKVHDQSSKAFTTYIHL